MDFLTMLAWFGGGILICLPISLALITIILIVKTMIEEWICGEKWKVIFWIVVPLILAFGIWGLNYLFKIGAI